MRATNKCGSVAEHMESYLGRISRGWGEAGSAHGIQVVSFTDKPVSEITTFATLGLSNYVLKLPKNRRVRQELIISANGSFSHEEIAGFMMSFAEHILKRGRALLRGEVVGPWRPIINGATVDAVYATNPTPFEEQFAVFEGTTPPTVFVLLVPITSDEANLVAKQGWNWFEDALELQDPNIWDLKRSAHITLDPNAN